MASVGGRRAHPQPVPDAAGHLRLPVLGKAPEFVDTQQWFNTPGDRPLTLRGLRGRVVLVDFWTYSCINCLRTLPYLKAWDARYRKDGLTIVGVHTPEFPFEHDASNVDEAIERNGLHYPVVQDNDLRHLERLRQPVLAGRVLHRRQRQRALSSTSARAPTARKNR